MGRVRGESENENESGNEIIKKKENDDIKELRMLLLSVYAL